jgi:hypothetical protein
VCVCEPRTSENENHNPLSFSFQEFVSFFFSCCYTFLCSSFLRFASPHSLSRTNDFGGYLLSWRLTLTWSALSGKESRFFGCKSWIWLACPFCNINLLIFFSLLGFFCEVGIWLFLLLLLPQYII